MEDFFQKLFDNNPQEAVDLFVNLHRLTLQNKPHIKKYNKLRKLHGEILDNMDDYLASGKLNTPYEFECSAKDISKETGQLDFFLDSSNPDDKTILIELFAYRNHPNITPLTEIYLKKNKFRNADKVKMLKSMNDSYASLFKVVDSDYENGYITYEDVFTKKKFKVVDISLSTTFRKGYHVYMYNRIITCDGISFGTGMHIMMSDENKSLQEYLKKGKYKDCSGFAKCIMLYDISKKEKKIKTSYNERY